MNPDGSPLSIPPGPATSVILGRIERELRDMWSAQLAPGEAPRSRACTMNLVVAASSRDAEVRKTLKGGGNIPAAKVVGEVLAQRAIAAGIPGVVFDRGGYAYHGRIKALADAARAAGLKF